MAFAIHFITASIAIETSLNLPDGPPIEKGLVQRITFLNKSRTGKYIYLIDVSVQVWDEDALEAELNEIECAWEAHQLSFLEEGLGKRSG